MSYAPLARVPPLNTTLVTALQFVIRRIASAAVVGNRVMAKSHPPGAIAGFPMDSGPPAAVRSRVETRGLQPAGNFPAYIFDARL